MKKRQIRNHFKWCVKWSCLFLFHLKCLVSSKLHCRRRERKGMTSRNSKSTDIHAKKWAITNVSSKKTHKESTIAWRSECMKQKMYEYYSRIWKAPLRIFCQEYYLITLFFYREQNTSFVATLTWPFEGYKITPNCYSCKKFTPIC